MLQKLSIIKMTFEKFAMLLVLAFALLSSTFAGQTTSGDYGYEQEERVAVTSFGNVTQCACNSTDFEDTILALQGLLACKYILLLFVVVFL